MQKWKKPVFFCYWLKHIVIIVNFNRYYASCASEWEREREDRDEW